MSLEDRSAFSIELCRAAGALARDHFARRDQLRVDQKGSQDWVSEADRKVESFIRESIAEAWPQDGVVGEEHDDTPGSNDFTWVIDPIDGTTNFLSGIPTWAVVLAGVSEGETRIGVVHDPIYGETFSALRGGGARLNGRAIRVAEGKTLDDGIVAVGYSNRVRAENVASTVAALVVRGTMFHRNASGALSLAYVAAGRLVGYVEEHMNAWDCLAGLLLVTEAGGLTEDLNADEMIREGGRVIAGAPQVFEELKSISTPAWGGSG